MRARAFAAVAVGLVLAGCGNYVKHYPARTERMRVYDVRLLSASGKDVPLPGANDPPLPLVLGTPVEFVIDIQALHEDGTLAKSFNGYVRISSDPGTVMQVVAPKALGRNAYVTNGVANDVHVFVQNPRGPTRLWVEDIGYEPADPFKPPACSDGKDNDGDGLIDYPEDPGCAYANDDSETGGQFAAGVSQPIYYALPRLSDVQGHGAVTPYSEEGVEVMTGPPADVIVTRVSSQGFFATDITDPGPPGLKYNNIYAFTFSTPGGIRVCDRLTQLSGTAADFFGFTELSFPSYEVSPWENATQSGPCKVPEPSLITSATLSPSEAAQMESLESGLVRIKNATVARDFGPTLAFAKQGSKLVVHIGPGQSNCDLDGNGTIDFTTPGSLEAACANACSGIPDCSEWTEYESRSNYRVNLSGGGGSILINTSTISGFDPVKMSGETLPDVTGTLRNFSGGSLNWTIETRCNDDLVCGTDKKSQSQLGCQTPQSKAQAPVPSDTACVSPRTIPDSNPGG